MIDLTDTAAVYARARQAYENQELQAQNLDVITNFCSYNGPCAIGVYMTPEQRREVEPYPDMSNSIHLLLENGKVSGDLEALADLQMAHDNWNETKAETADYAADFEVDFLIQMWKY